MIIERLKQLQGNQTDQQFADKLGIHRVSWQRIKNRRVPISDKFLVRVNRAFPRLDIFLTDDFQEGKQTVPTVNHNASENAQDGKLGRFRGWLRDCIGRAWKLWHNSREP